MVGRDLSIDPIEILTHLTGTRRGLNNQSSLNSNVTVPNSAAVAAAAAAAAAGQLQQIQQIERSAEDRRTLNSLDINRDRGLTRRAGAPRSVNASAAGLSVANMIGSNGLPYLVLMDSGSHVNVSSLGNSVANSASNLPASGALLSNDHQQSSATTSAPTPATGTTVPQSSTSATQTSRLLLSR